VGKAARALLDVERGWLVTVVAFAVFLLLPAFRSNTIPTLTEGLVILTMCYAWNLVGGYLGEMSFAHMIFWAVGGYGVVFVINAEKPPLPWLLGLVVAAAAAGAGVAFLIRAARLEGLLPVSIFTLVLGQIVFTLVSGTDIFGRTEGIIVQSLPTLSQYAFFLVLVALTALAGFLNVAVANSRFGRELLAIRDDPVAANVAGINVSRRRYVAYILSAALFALGGAYQAYYGGSASPGLMLGVGPLILVSLAIFIGGPGTALGPLVGAIIIYGIQAAAVQISDSPNVALYAQLIAYGVALLLLRLITPRLKGNDLATAAIRAVARPFTRREAAPTAKAPVRVNAAEFVDRTLAQGQVSQGLAGEDARGVELTGVEKSFGALQVLRGVSFRIDPGEVVGIVGPNGAGKSTLCNLISGIERVSGGSITLHAKEISSVPTYQRSSHGMGRSFQTPRLFQSLSLPENLTLARHHLSNTDAVEILSEMGIENSRRRKGDDSQFFARRLTEVTKAAMQGSSVLMLDEPLAGLTPDEQDIVLQLARKAADEGACVAIVEHLIPVLAPAVDRIVVLHNGRIVADGAPAVVLQQDEVVEAYLGAPHTMEESK
jgi:branched-chain amino acid transport system permease protein